MTHMPCHFVVMKCHAGQFTGDSLSGELDLPVPVLSMRGGAVERLRLIPRAGLEALRQKRLDQSDRNQVRVANCSWLHIYTAVVNACECRKEDLPDALISLVKFKNTYFFAIAQLKEGDEVEHKTALRLFNELLSAPSEAAAATRPFTYAAPDLQHLASWRSLYPGGSQITVLMLIGLLAFLAKRTPSGPAVTPPTLGSLRNRYSSLRLPVSKVDVALLPIYTQQLQEQSRVHGSQVLEAHARGATLPAGPTHATTGRPPLTQAEKQHPIRFATREAFEPTPELWTHGDDDRRPKSIGIPACAHCRSWLYDTESCPACLDGKLAAAFAHKPPGEEMGRFEIVPLSTRHDGPIVTEEQKQHRIFVPFDPAERAKTTELRKARMPAEQPG